MGDIMRKAIFLAAAAGLALVGAALHSQPSAAPPQAALQLAYPDYEPQKVVYHINSGANWFGSEHRQRLNVLRNHVRALPAQSSDIRVVLQGSGLDLLVVARKDIALSAQIDDLKKAGVRFLVCANTVATRKIDLERDLHGVVASDFVKAGVAETARLQSLGFVYLKI
jgi:uncharacterized protein